jgi:hypothetical protein
MKAYEIHTYREGQWKVDSVFDDRDLALHEARKVDENRRYTGIRVIEENYDAATDLTTTRTIFRGKNESEKPKVRTSTAKKSSRAGNRGKSERERKGKGRARPQKKKSGGVLVPVLILCLLVISGVAVMFGLHHFGGIR